MFDIHKDDNWKTLIPSLHQEPHTSTVWCKKYSVRQLACIDTECYATIANLTGLNWLARFLKHQISLGVFELIVKPVKRWILTCSMFQLGIPNCVSGRWIPRVSFEVYKHPLWNQRLKHGDWKVIVWVWPPPSNSYHKIPQGLFHF